MLGLSIALTVLISLSYRHSYSIYLSHEQHAKLIRLHHDLIHSSDNLTADVRFLAHTRDPMYERKFRTDEKSFNELIHEAKSSAVSKPALNAIEQVEIERTQLNALEEEAIKLIEEGNQTAASDIVFSQAYREHKRNLNTAISRAIEITDGYFKVSNAGIRRIASVSDANSAKNDLLIAIWFAMGFVIVSHFVLARSRNREEIREKTLEQTRADSSASSERLKLAIDSMGIGVWEIDAATGALTLDQKIYEMYQLDPSLPHLQREEYLEKIHPDDRAQVISRFDEAYRSGQLSTRFRIVRSCGEIRHLRVLGRVPTPGRNGSVKLVGITWDITEDVRIHETIEDQRAKLATSARLASLGEMAGGVAHEINNPLQIIMGLASLVRTKIMREPDGKITSDEVLKAFERIEATADRIGRIVKGLRTVARDGDHDPFEPSLASNIAQDALSLCTERIKRNDVDLEVIVDDNDLTLIECRSVQVSQILLNLLTNAFHAASASQDRWVKIEATAYPEYYEYAVSDSGPGISDKIREKIFQPFFTTKEVGQGTGLGLSISLSIAREHNGELFLDPASPHTRFVLRLPLVQAKAASEAA